MKINHISRFDKLKCFTCPQFYDIHYKMPIKIVQKNNFQKKLSVSQTTDRHFFILPFINQNFLKVSFGHLSQAQANDKVSKEKIKFPGQILQRQF